MRKGGRLRHVNTRARVDVHESVSVSARGRQRRTYFALSGVTRSTSVIFVLLLLAGITMVEGWGWLGQEKDESRKNTTSGGEGETVHDWIINHSECPSFHVCFYVRSHSS